MTMVEVGRQYKIDMEGYSAWCLEVSKKGLLWFGTDDVVTVLATRPALNGELARVETDDRGMTFTSQIPSRFLVPVEEYAS